MFWLSAKQPEGNQRHNGVQNAIELIAACACIAGAKTQFIADLQAMKAIGWASNGCGNPLDWALMLHQFSDSPSICHA